MTIRDLTVAGLKPCRECPRLDSILMGAHRLAKLAPLTAEDVEELALMVCAGCVEEVACEQEPGRGWVLNLAPRQEARPCS